MRLHRFFIQDEEPMEVDHDIGVYNVDLLHQWKNVFRLRTGDKVILLDNSGMEYLATIRSLTKEKAELEIGESKAGLNIPSREIWLFAALVKKDNFEWILEKGTELGVSNFVPVVSERSEKKNLNMERAVKITREASEQSGRGILPRVHDIVTLEEIFDPKAPIAAGIENVQLIAFHPEGKPFDTQLFKSPSRKLGAGPMKTPIGVFIGPEGGWSEKENDLFTAKNIPIFSLGPQILRAETAAIAVASLLLL